MEFCEDIIDVVVGCYSIQVDEKRIILVCLIEICVLLRDGQVERIIEIKDWGMCYVYRVLDGIIFYINKMVLVSVKGNVKEMQYLDKELWFFCGFIVDKEVNYYVCGMDFNNIY